MPDFAAIRLSEEEVRSLASDRLPILRSDRYTGGRQSTRIADVLDEDEAEDLRAFYAELQQLMELSREGGDSNSEHRRKLVDFCAESALTDLSTRLDRVRHAARASGDTELATLLEEVTSGPFASIFGYLLIIRAGGFEPEYARTLYYLSRDQLKIVRSLFVDIDPEARERDEEARLHGLDLILEKWDRAQYRAFDNAVDVEVVSDVEGYVAERCIEFAEVDRLMYLIANNVLRFAKDGRLSIRVVRTSDGNSLRWAFANPISEEQSSLLAFLKSQGRSIFEHGVATQGNGDGQGLGVLADSVLHAYGLDNLYTAENQGYFGYKALGERFVLWFHWPAAGVL